MQSGIFGAITSGNEKTTSLLVSKIEGVELITGGQFGPEGTIQAFVFCLTAGLILMVLNHIQKNWLSLIGRNKMNRPEQ